MFEVLRRVALVCAIALTIALLLASVMPSAGQAFAGELHRRAHLVSFAALALAWRWSLPRGRHTMPGAPEEAAMKRDADEAVAGLMKPMKREDVTDLIAFRKVKKAIKWADVAKKVGQSKEWTTAACLGQMQMTKKQAETV